MKKNKFPIKHPRDLLYARRRLGSLDGETGILLACLNELPNRDLWCVEFGALDGVQFSNTLFLVDNYHYNAVYIEGNSRNYLELAKNMLGRPKVICLNEMVGVSEEDSLHALLSRTEIPVDFDLLVIDVDNNDYHILEALRTYTPKVVMVEINNTLRPEVEKIAELNAPFVFGKHGTSLYSMTIMMNSKGYKLVCNCSCNAIYVQEQYYPFILDGEHHIPAFYTWEGVPARGIFKEMSLAEIMVKFSEAVKRERCYGVGLMNSILSSLTRYFRA